MSSHARFKYARRIGVIFAVAVAFAIVAASQAFAGTTTSTLYVTSAGSDASTCAASAPCATVAHALTVGASDYSAGNAVTISVGAGTFPEHQLVLSYPVSLQGSGASATTIDVTGTSDGCASPDAVLISGQANACGTEPAAIAGAYAISGATVEGVAGVTTSASTTGEPVIVAITALPADTTVAFTNDDFVASSAIDPHLDVDQSYGVYVQPSGTASSTSSSITIQGDDFSGMSVGAFFNPFPGQLTLADSTFAGLLPSGSAGVNYQPATGVMLFDAASTTAPMTASDAISGNSFSGYGGYGVMLESGYNDAPGVIENVAITNNTFDLPVGSDTYGDTTGPIYLYDSSSSGTSVLSNTSITGNSITTSGTGALDVQVYVGADQTYSGNVIEGNDILGGSGVVGVNEPTVPIVGAADNYWGDPSGPSGQGAGDGTAASTRVDYSPWWTTTDGAPTAPTNVTVTPGIGDAVISWGAPALSGTSNGTIGSYTITGSPGGTSTTVPGSATSATVTGLTAGDSYQFTVSATTATATGPSATSDNVTVLAPTPTPPPVTPAPTPTVPVPVPVPAPAPPTTTVAPPPTGIPVTTLGTPTTATVEGSSSTTVDQSAGGASAIISIPAGALPSGSVVSVYPITNATALTAGIRAGQAYVTAFAISWQAPDGTSPTALAPITITIHQPGITKGDTVYELTFKGTLRPVGTATANGVVTITFDNDPVFVLAAAPKLTLTATRTKVTSRDVNIELRCTAAASCRGTATLSSTPKSQRAHTTTVRYATVASAHFRIARGKSATIHLQITNPGHSALARQTHKQRLRLSLATTLTGGLRTVKTILLPRVR